MKIRLKHLLLPLLLLLAVGCGAQTPPQNTVPAPVPELESGEPIQPPPDIPAEILPETTPEAPPQTEAEFLPEQDVQTDTEDESIPENEHLPENETASPSEEETQAEIDSVPPEPEVLPEPVGTALPVLMYHHVVPDGTACNDMTVTVSKLSGDLQWLTEHGYETILPRDLASGVPLPEKPVLITFDDGYRSNYDLAYPLFQQYQTKAVISIMVYMQDSNIGSFLSWDMCREMVESGLVEIGSHTYLLHNLDGRNGSFTPGGINGIQRNPEESDEDFQFRVLDDLQKSHDLIKAQIGQDVTFFAYPFGIREPEAESLIESLFPVTAVTLKGTANLSEGVKNLPRWTITMNTSLASILDA